MNFIDSSGDGQWPRGSHNCEGATAKARGGRRRRRLVYDPLESRQLLALSAPVAEFPARTLGGIPVGNVVDPSGNDWVLLSSGNIAETSNSGGVVAQFTVPSYNSLAGTPTGSELGLITYDAVDGDLWFYETNSNKFGMLNPVLRRDHRVSRALLFAPIPPSIKLPPGRRQHLVHRARPERSRHVRHQDRPDQSVHDAPARHTTPGDHGRARRQSLVHGRRPEPARQHQPVHPRPHQLCIRTAQLYQ